MVKLFKISVMLLRIKKYIFIFTGIILQLLSYSLYFFSGFSKRDPKTWLFGCWNGRKFRGNSKYLYFYVKNNYPDIVAVWITKDRRLIYKLRKEGVNVYYAYSLKGIQMTLRAKYFFVTHGIRDINEFVSRRGILINLEHFVCPIKDTRLPSCNSLFGKIYCYLFGPYAYVIKPDYAITSSKFTSVATKRHFGISEDRIIPMGTPKADFLLAAKNDKEDEAKFHMADKKRILFLPTWRGDPKFSIFNFGFDVKTLNYLLEKINGVIAFNFHPFMAARQKISDVTGYDNIKCFNYQGDEMNRLLSKADLLITDYSSLFADFLIYDKPIIFANFDHENYLREMNLFFDYDNGLPGPKARNWQELIYQMREIFLNERDEYRMKRKELRDLIYPNLDGKACERITQFILSLSS